MNDQEWWSHRAEMSNYMPTMIAFKRKRSGWKRTVENIVFWVLLAVYLGLIAVGGFLAFVKWNFNPVLYGIIAVVATFWLGNRVHELLYTDDTGLHNLEGYDQVTGTVPDLEARGFNIREFWPNPGHPRYQRRRR